uniref:Uncharacterized protein n=1 Tax=Anguilla anguilla TaxID=7936 RepID=A0A0E9TFJ9_ANGAN
MLLQILYLIEDIQLRHSCNLPLYLVHSKGASSRQQLAAVSITPLRMGSL